MKRIIALAATLVLAVQLPAQIHLTTDLVEHTDIEYASGRKALVCSSRPTFGWVLEKKQKACRISLTLNDGTPVWDSGRLRGSLSTGIPCGVTLRPSTEYLWQVTVWSGFRKTKSQPKSFTTAAVLDKDWTVSPLATSVQTLAATEVEEGVWLADFQKDAYAQISITLDLESPAAVTVHLGEKALADNRPDRNPGGTVRYCSYTLEADAGQHSYDIELRRDPRNAKHFGKPNPANDPPILMPDYVGEVYPFRYVEIDCPGKVQQVSRTVVNYPFDDDAASFRCSDETLNAVWELCKYSMKATSFCGYYVDGDRERIPYEADALINQLGHYYTDREYAMARRTVDYLIFHPTWPTEWNLQIPILAWRDYLYSGDDRLLRARYADIVAKAMIPLRDERGLISTVDVDLRDVHDALHFHDGTQIRDIVDWPRVGGFGAPGEDDGYDLKPYNTVVNAYHYEALVLLAKIATAIGKPDDAATFSDMAAQTRKALLELCYDSTDGAFRDGIGTNHKALHATLFPLAFGLVPQEGLERSLEFIHSRGLACSVYGVQMLLEGLFDAGDDDYALSLMTSHSDRSWYNMMAEGATITMEAWGTVYKPNQDWNHAWGAAPANIIPRKVLGVEPLSPGCDTILVRPHLGTLQFAEGTVPTIKGPVHVHAEKSSAGTVSFTVSAPPGVTVIR